MERRTFLTLSAATLAMIKVAGIVGPGFISEAAASTRRSGAVYVPGYWPEEVYFRGRKGVGHRRLARAVPKNYDGPLRMFTRVGAGGSVRQAILPVKGHGVEIAPDGKLGCFAGMEGSNHVAFDPDDLDLVAIGKPFGEGWRGGGHCQYVRDGDAVVVAERAPRSRYSGRPEDYFGRLTIRDPRTLKILDSYSTYGIDPHDIRLLDDGRHIAIANYGSVSIAGEMNLEAPRSVKQACVTIVDLADGSLVSKIETNRRDRELRHLCADRMDRIFAIQAKLGSREDEARYLRNNDEAYENDITVQRGQYYLPAPILKISAKSQSFKALGDSSQRRLMRQGLSIRYDPNFDEAIATYPSTHRIMVFDGATGRVKRSIDTSSLGLRYPAGLALHPDGKHYVVTGYWENMFVFSRGRHTLNRDMCAYEVFFGHSHNTAA